MSREERIAEVLAEWRAARKAGGSGGAEDLVRAHPDLADELRARVAAIDLLDQVFAGSAPAPAQIGEYRIVREIGRGGMGVVYEAEQTSMRRKVALKVLFPSVTSSPKAVKRFQQEAWAAGRLKHTNIVGVHQLGHEGGTWFCAMELVEGRPLSDVIAEMRRAGRPPRESRLARRALGAASKGLAPDTATGTRAYYVRVAEMFAEVAEALQVAHDHGVVHRDVKPANLLLDAEGRLKLADFGLARLEGGAAAMTVTGETIGTPLYMSPEQVVGGRGGVDARTDIYSLGATLYEALTLRPPFRGDNMQKLAAAILRGSRLAPRRRDRGIPRDLETIVLKATDVEPARRYRTAGEMAQDLRLFAQEGAIRARRIGLVGRAWRVVRRNKLRAGLAAAAAILAAVALFAQLRGQAEGRRSRSLEYALLCGEAEGQRLAAALAPDVSAKGAVAVPLVEDRSRETYERAIALEPDRHEAYFGLALHPGLSVERRLEALDRAEARGAPLRTVHLARAMILAVHHEEERAREEERLAALLPRGDARDALFEGRILALRADYDASERLLTEAIAAAQPGSGTRYMALYSRGLLRVKRRDYASALEDFLGVQAAGGSSVAVQVRIASLWERLAHPERAQAILDGLLVAARRSDSEDPWAALCEGLNACEMHEWTDRVWKEIPGAQADCPRLRWAHIEALLQLKRLDEALVACDRAIQLDPASAPAHGNRGVVLQQLRRLDEALVEYDRAIQLDPSFAGAHSKRGLVLQELHRLDEALAEGDRAIQIDASDASAHSLRGSVLSRLGRFDEALAAHARAAELEPGSSLPHESRAAVLNNLHRYSEALEAADRALALDPQSADAHYVRAFAFRGLKRPEEARVAAEKAVALDPTNGGACEVLGHFYEEERRYDKALESYEKATRLGIGLGLATFLADCEDPRFRDPGRAVELARQCARRWPGAAPVWCVLGEALYRSDAFEESIAAVKRALELDPQNPAIVARSFVVAMALHRLGRADEAGTWYERGMSTSSEDDDAGFRRWREEAAGLLGIDASMKTGGSR